MKTILKCSIFGPEFTHFLIAARLSLLAIVLLVNHAVCSHREVMAACAQRCQPARRACLALQNALSSGSDPLLLPGSSPRMPGMAPVNDKAKPTKYFPASERTRSLRDNRRHHRTNGQEGVNREGVTTRMGLGGGGAVGVGSLTLREQTWGVAGDPRWRK